MSRNYLPLTKYANGDSRARLLQDKDVVCKRGWYNVVKNYTISPDYTGIQFFTIPYVTNNPLYDSFSPAIAGGVVDINQAKDVESYLVPYKSSGQISFNECLDFSINNIPNINLVKVRKSISKEPFIYHPSSQYNYQMYLLCGYSGSDPLHISHEPTHYFYWVYFNNGGCSLVPQDDPGLPVDYETIDMWIGVNTDLQNMPWDSGLVQDIAMYSTLQSPSNFLDFEKASYTIPDNSNIFNGTVPFGINFNCETLFGSKLVVAFLNGIEVNCAIKNIASATSDDDIILDTGSVNYPEATDIYWNGSSRGISKLGDLKAGNVIRLYYPKSL